LLDTHAWLWLTQGNPALGTEARNRITEAATTGRLRLATISLWEIAMLASRGRIELAKPALAWIGEALARSRVALEPLSPEIAVESCALPAGFRSDPADQIIVATARVTGAALMTRDRDILAYAAAGHLAALPA
jgi:PIN domain nuclease of toxin-antitoxin system